MTNRKKLLIVPGFTCDVFSPIEELSFHLSESLSAEWDVIWLVPTINNGLNKFKSNESRHKLSEPLYVSYLKQKGIRYVIGDLSKYNFLNNYRIFHRVFREEHIDCVLTQFGFERFLAAFWAKIFNKKIIWYEHWTSLKTKYIFLKYLFYFFFVDYFLAVSDYIKQSLPQFRKIFVLRNAITVSPLKELSETQKERTKLELGLSNFAHIVLIIAAFREDKRLDISVEVAEKVLKSTQDTCFIFLGDGPLRNSIQELVRSKGLEKNSFFAGHRLDVANFLEISDVLILTSPQEGFGICLLEAMANQLPVVAFNSAGPHEILEDKVTGFLVPWLEIDIFADHICTLLKDPALRNKMGKAGRARLEKEFNIEVWKDSVRNIFSEIGKKIS